MTDFEKESNNEGASKFTVTDRRHWVDESAIDPSEGSEPRLPTFVEKLKQEAEEKDKRLKEYINAYKEKNAETDEFRARLQRENEVRLDQAKAKLMGRMIPVFDNLKRACTAAEANKDYESLRTGLDMIIKQFDREMQHQGIETIPAEGRTFDPKTDEALMTEETDDPAKDNLVLEILEPGYVYKDKLIKPVKVKVGKLKQ